MAKKKVKKVSRARPQAHSKAHIPSRKERIPQSLAIVCLVLNIIILPGIGTLIGRKTKEGIAQLVILLGTLIIGFMISMTISGIVIGVPLIVVGFLVSWIWSIVSGAKLIQESA